MLPLFAAQVLQVGATELGLLFLMVGARTVLASGVQAWLGAGRHIGVFLAGLPVWSLALVVFAFSSSLLLSAAALLVHGAARNGVGTTAVTLMQLHSPDAVRGRVMSLNTLMAHGMRPLGDFGISAAMAASSVQLAAAACGGLVRLYVLVLWPRLQRTVLPQAEPLTPPALQGRGVAAVPNRES
ncbi:membrane protein implicated in regulation of membrane protease activity [Deinobacterium chartae]|uniref:Membrane protein implicated in regulation of membrane protease activity n=1 Tax=Deinobacterium chartae TaxID=521158 RepID=A0A841I0C9_9DEIO|nr:membrane protein implicated in regulation of membrane protease activity [Deinobacterium chartae]